MSCSASRLGSSDLPRDLMQFGSHVLIALCPQTPAVQYTYSGASVDEMFCSKDLEQGLSFSSRDKVAD
jgi:hypothetical protein